MDILVMATQDMYSTDNDLQPTMYNIDSCTNPNAQL